MWTFKTSGKFFYIEKSWKSHDRILGHFYVNYDFLDWYLHGLHIDKIK